MLLIVGLGNIGSEYEKTYHNMGFCVLNLLANHFEQKINKKECSSETSVFEYQKEKIILAKPQTYMNASGEAVKSLVKKYKIDIEKDLIVVYDDIALVAGNVRIKKDGSSGGHNGMKDIIDKLSTNKFIRCKVAIGPKPEKIELANYVLSKFNEQSKVSQGIERAKQAILDYIAIKNIDDVMTNYNKTV